MGSRFMTAYLCLYISEYAEALDHFMQIENYEGQRGSIMQGAWALRRYMGDGTSNFAQALQGEELEPAPRPTVFVGIVQKIEQLADGGGQPSAELWESLRLLVQERHPRLMKELQQMDLSRSELQMCLLSAISLRQKQVATLLGISPQNLRNQRLRLLARITGRQTDSVADFAEWIEGMKS